MKMIRPFRFRIGFWVLWMISNAHGQAFRLEAEDAALTGVSKSTQRSGYSGAGYVTGFDQDTDRILFSFTAAEGLYGLTIGFSTPNGEKGYSLAVNGIPADGMFPATGNAWGVKQAGKVFLKEGAGTAVIGKNWGWFDIDYIEFTRAETNPVIRPPGTLSNPSSGETTRSLFSYLVDQFGEKILSGQIDLSEIEYVHTVTGKYPAIHAMDLMDYSPSRIEHGANPSGNMETWIQWVKGKNAILSLSWHWNAPSGLINTSGKEWWRGFYTDATTFDLRAAMADPGSNDYRLLIRDMDAIAVQLKKAGAADVPVLWRPLHEASGGWFWWGAKGPEPFKALWRLMHDRYTTVHGLNHLIWVYTAGDTAWYPGDAFVDVVSLDIYSPQGSSLSGDWEGILSHFNGRKLIALSESGSLPVPESVRSYATWWSWFMIWSGTYIRDADKALLTRVYADSDVVTLDELPDWRHYNGLDGGGEKDGPVGLFPNPADARASIRLGMAAGESASVRVFDLRGRAVSSASFTSQSEGPVDIPVETAELACGLYLVRVGTASEVGVYRLAVVR
jgi:mannan endo-1,4-beta-mannosidase